MASIVVYGVLSYLVTQRTREMGIRMALGATRAQVVRNVLKQGGRLIMVGLPLGLAGASVATRLLASLLFGVRPCDTVMHSLFQPKKIFPRCGWPSWPIPWCSEFLSDAKATT